MSTSLYIKGVKSPTPKYISMYRVYQACEDAGVPVPEEVMRFFVHKTFRSVPSDGMETDLHDHPSVRWNTPYYEAVIELSELPEGTTRLRVIMG